jgi:hypothetical protein
MGLTQKELNEIKLNAGRMLLYGINQYVPNQTFRLDLLLHDINFMSLRPVTKADQLYGEWLVLHRETLSYQAWANKNRKLFNECKFEDEYPKTTTVTYNKNSWSCSTLPATAPYTTPLVISAAKFTPTPCAVWSLFQGKRLEKLFNVLEKEKYITFQHLKGFTFYKINKEKIEEINKYAFIELV